MSRLPKTCRVNIRVSQALMEFLRDYTDAAGISITDLITDYLFMLQEQSSVKGEEDSIGRQI